MKLSTGTMPYALASRDGVRVGVTWHRIADTETIMQLEFGVGRLK